MVAITDHRNADAIAIGSLGVALDASTCGTKVGAAGRQTAVLITARAADGDTRGGARRAAAAAAPHACIRDSGPCRATLTVQALVVRNDRRVAEGAAVGVARLAALPAHVPCGLCVWHYLQHITFVIICSITSYTCCMVKKLG